MTVLDRRRALMGVQEGGETLYINEYTGQYYPKNLDFTDSSPSTTVNERFTRRWLLCQELETAKVTLTQRLGAIGSNGGGSEAFSRCPKLKTLEIVNGVGSSTYLASYCPMLQTVILGSIGHPVSGAYSNAFLNSGGSASNKTLTIYVSDDTTIPLSGAPYGLTGATVIYRSATTGEIKEVPST